MAMVGLVTLKYRVSWLFLIHFLSIIVDNQSIKPKTHVKLVKEVTHRGLEVTAIARNVDKIMDQEVNKVSVDVNHIDDLTRVLTGHDAVVECMEKLKNISAL